MGRYNTSILLRILHEIFASLPENQGSQNTYVLKILLAASRNREEKRDILERKERKKRREEEGRQNISTSILNLLPIPSNL